MPGHDPRFDLSGSIDEATLRPVVRSVLVVVAAVFLLLLVAALPGLNRLFVGSGVMFSAVVVATMALVTAGVMVQASPRIESVVVEALTGPEELVAAAGAVVKNLVLFGAVLVAYRGLGVAVTPLLAPIDAVWLYDAVFLVLSLGPVGMVGYHIYGHFDAVADHLTGELAAALEAETRDAGETP